MDVGIEFRDAARSMTGLTASLEKRTLIWLAERLPRWLNSDHLTSLALLVAYLLLLVETFLATQTLGNFKMSYFKVGPTELRILLACGNLVLLVHPMAEIFGREFRLFDVGGVVAIAGMAVTLVHATARHARALYVAGQ